MMNKEFYDNYVRKGTQTINRFCMEDVVKKQNLAEHGYHAANIFLVACTIKKYKPSVTELEKVLNHDAIETVTGDLNKKIKDKSQATKDAWNVIEKEVADGCMADYAEEEIEKGTTMFKRLFRFSDAMEAYLYCQEEARRGNTNLIGAETYYESLLQTTYKDIFEAWVRF